MLISLLLAGCGTPSQSNSNAARSYLYPDFKTIMEPKFAMTAAERRSAIREWREEAKTAQNSGILYEVIVDGKGNVVRIHAVQPYPKDDNEGYYTHQFQLVVQGYKFRRDAVPEAYRTFFYPMLIKSAPHPINEP